MQSYFEKMKGSAMKAAKQGMQLLATVSAVASDTVSAVASDLAITPQYNTGRKPQEEFTLLFKAICEAIDEIADSDDADSPEADRRLYDSRARSCLKAMVALLQTESDRWVKQYADSPDPEVNELPCLDRFLQTHVMQELSSRAVRDLPRGCLPLVLGSTAALLRGVRYPLLPHQTVHKPIAHLVSVAARFDAMNFAGSDSTSKQELASYKKRIGESEAIAFNWLFLKKKINLLF